MDRGLSAQHHVGSFFGEEPVTPRPLHRRAPTHTKPTVYASLLWLFPVLADWTSHRWPGPHSPRFPSASGAAGAAGDGRSCVCLSAPPSFLCVYTGALPTPPLLRRCPPLYSSGAQPLGGSPFICRQPPNLSPSPPYVRGRSLHLTRRFRKKPASA